MSLLKILSGFLTSFPTATILYALLVVLGDVKFELFWLIFAVVIDIIDDVVVSKI